MIKKYCLHITLTVDWGVKHEKNMSLRMRKPTICISENKGADQLRSNCEADQCLCFHYTDCTIPLLSKFKISSLLPSSMTVQPGLCRTWSEPKLFVFSQTGSYSISGENVVQGLSWSLVAEKVITRSEKQCRTKWLNYLNWKQKGGTDWTREDDMNLILRVVNLGVANDTEIDWNELSKDWKR